MQRWRESWTERESEREFVSKRSSHLCEWAANSWSRGCKMSVPRLTRWVMTGNRFPPAFSHSLSKASGQPVCCDASPASRCCCPPARARVCISKVWHIFTRPSTETHTHLHYHQFMVMSSECLLQQIVHLFFSFCFHCFSFSTFYKFAWFHK